MNHVRSLIAAVDGGGSGSRLIAVDEELRVVAYARGPPLNYAATGPERFEEALRALRASLPASPKVLAASLAGVSAYRAEAGEALRRVFRPRRLILMTDMEASLHAATCGGDGVIVSAGTGSFAYGRRGGVEARAGGWGYLFGDEGGAYWLGREAVRAALAAMEEGCVTGLSRMVSEALGCRGLEGCIRAAYAAGREGVAGLAPRICGLAAGGGEAYVLLLRGAGLLAGLALRVYRRLGFSSGLVYGTGGVLLGCGLYARLLSAELGRSGVSLRLSRAGPLEGALAAALGEAGLGGCVEAGNVIRSAGALEG